MHNAKFIQLQVGMGGAYHSWSSTYPDLRGLLINTCDLKLEKKDTTDHCRRIDLNGEFDVFKTTFWKYMYKLNGT